MEIKNRQAVQRRGMYIEESQMNQEQRDIIDAKGDVSYIVQGCAGSGKSCLALLKAIRLEQMRPRPRYYFVTFFQLLSKVLKGEMEYAKAGGYQVMTFKEWEKNHVEADYILVDECQDLSLENIIELNNSKRRALFLYGDDTQQIMDFIKNRRPVALKRIRTELNLPVFKLRLNYRLPKKVALFAQQISGRKDLYDHCQNEGGNKPYVVRVSRDPAEQARLIAEIVRDKFHFQNVGVLCRSNEDVKKLYKAWSEQSLGVSVSAKWWIKKKDNNGYDPFAFYGNSRRRSRDDIDSSELADTTVQIMTCHQAKGLQFEAVFLLSWPDLKDELEVNCYYVAVTRTYNSLFVFYTDRLPSVVDNIPREYYNNSLASSQENILQV